MATEVLLLVRVTMNAPLVRVNA